MAHEEAFEIAQGAGRLIVVSNRLPYTLFRRDDGTFAARKSSGGLVSALEPVLRERGGTWIGWGGTTDADAEELYRALHRFAADAPYRLFPIKLTDTERDAFYHGFSNEVLWPLLHGMPTRCRFESHYWRIYREVNRRYAQVIWETADPQDVVWIHDYHLMRAPAYLKQLGTSSRVGFFLHTPFPPVDVFRVLPWRHEILAGMLTCDLIGLQAVRDMRNLRECIRASAEELELGTHAEPQIRVLPIGIDFDRWNALASRPDIARQAEALRGDLQDGTVVCGVDRLDYTKGIEERLRAFETLLERFPELRERVTLVQYVVPSRERVQGYRELRRRLERLVGEIHGRFGTPRWSPIRYFFNELPQEQLAALYRAADVVFITSLNDGMNLIAKEFCAARADLDGVLVLSELAGVTEQLRTAAVLVNPHDVEGMAEALRRAIAMGPDERRRRMVELRRIVRGSDVGDWAATFLQSLGRTGAPVRRL